MHLKNKKLYRITGRREGFVHGKKIDHLEYNKTLTTAREKEGT